jgi:hypothetical protein
VVAAPRAPATVTVTDIEATIEVVDLPGSARSLV